MSSRIAPDRGGPHRGGRGDGFFGAPRGDSVGLPSIGEHVTTVGEKRPDYGTSGRPYWVKTNNYVVTIPQKIIRHYDVAISPDTLPTRVNNELIKKLQYEIAADIFTPRAVYDGRKNLFASHELRLGPSNAREFDVSFSAGSATRPPRVYKIKITKVAEINPEVLERFIAGEQSHDNQVLTAIMALNVVVRMEPNSKFPSNVRSFFTPAETRDIGAGITLWRGYFQSVRPGIGKMLINIDISTGAMYKAGPLLNLALEVVGKNHPSYLSPKKGLPDRERVRLQRFLQNLRVVTPHLDKKKPNQRARSVKSLSREGADSITFDCRGTQMTVAQYFRNQNVRLQFPEILCVELGNGAMLPMELCVVPPGQLTRKQVPSDKTADVVAFATKRPDGRFDSIEKGTRVLEYGQSEYVRDFGMKVDTSAPISLQARVLNPPKLLYGPKSREPQIVPRDGAWNMRDKLFYKPVTIKRWVVVIFAMSRQFGQDQAQEMVRGFVQGCRAVGMVIEDNSPPIQYANGQGNIGQQLRNAGQEVVKTKRGGPELVVVVLPEGGNDIYTAVKHFGDVSMGVATQCLKAIKCRGAKPQYWANVCLKMNVKLGGINLIPEPQSVSVLTDPNNPTIVMGADVIHPAPGAVGRPSFTAVVGNVDSHTAKYVATTRVQTSRQEMIDDLREMCGEILKMYMDYRAAEEKKRNPPVRLIFYRDGVSEGQFQQVLEKELPLIRAACTDMKINPKITLIVVGKRHHVRFLPSDLTTADRSGNCPAGLVVDTDICHPVEYDFFLQSHGGLIGTSRPSHYSVLRDENSMNANSMQALSFALCHVYARATRSVSIPAPVYYADIVCSRAKNHYDPAGNLDLSDTGTQVTSGTGALESFRSEYKKLHPNQSKLMYFM